MAGMLQIDAYTASQLSTAADTTRQRRNRVKQSVGYIIASTSFPGDFCYYIIYTRTSAASAMFINRILSDHHMATIIHTPLPMLYELLTFTQRSIL